MTAQVRDAIHVEGRWRPLACEPLRSWLRRRRNRQLRFRQPHTACRRGYVAQWEVVHGRLYLTRFTARLPNGRFAGLANLFANCAEPSYRDRRATDPANQEPGRFAFWVSETLVCPIGRVRRYAHAGYESVHEAELHLVFDRGWLVGQSIVAPPAGASATRR